MQQHSSSRKSRQRRAPKQPSKHIRVKTSCTTCRDKKLRCDRAKPCESCCKRRITDECRYDDGHNDDARAHASVRKGLQERIDALEQENAEHRNKISELVEANNRAADVFCQTTDIMASSRDLLTLPLSPVPIGSYTSLPVRTRDRPVLTKRRGPDHWQNQMRSSEISRGMLQNETDKLHSLQQLVLLTARSIVIQASPALDNGNLSFDKVVWQQACYAAVVLGTSMYERGDFDTDHGRLEATFQSIQRLRNQHPTDPQLESAAAKLHWFLHSETLNEAFARPSSLPQAMPVNPCAMDAVPAFILLANPRSEDQQQTRSTVVTSRLPNDQKAPIFSKQKHRRKTPVMLETVAMDIPSDVVLPDPALHAVPSTTGPLTSKFEILPTGAPELYHPTLADPTSASSTLMIAPETHAESWDMVDPRLYADRRIGDLMPVSHPSQILVPSSTSATFINPEDIAAGLMTSHTDYLQYHPPLNPSYFMQGTCQADVGHTLSSNPGPQPLAYGLDPLQVDAIPQQSPVVNVRHMESFSSDDTNTGIGTCNSIGVVEYMAQDTL